MSHTIKILISTGRGRLLDACLGVDVITKERDDKSPGWFVYFHW